MTAPVASAPSVRAPRQPGNDGDPHGGAPFASALDGALNAGRDHDVAPSARRGPQPDQRPDGGHRRPAGRDHADAPGPRQPAGPRAHGHGERGTRRAADRDPGRAPSTSTDDANPPLDPADAVETGAAAAVPAVWVLPPAPAQPPASAADAPDAAAVAGVDGAAPTTGSGPVVPTPMPALPGLQLPDDGGPALPLADPGSPAPSQPPVAPAAPGTPGLPGTAAQGAVAGAAGMTVPTAAGSPSASSATPPPLSATPADGGSPALPPVAPPPLLPVGPLPAWARAASAATAAAPTGDAGAPAPAAAAGAALPDAGPVSAAPAPVTAESASSDAGDTSRQDQGVPVADPSAGLVAPPSVAPATPVAPVAATAAPAPPAPVATQVATQVVALSQGPDATHSVTLVLHPDNLGPVHVQMTLAQGTVDLTLRGAHEHGRAALVDALPDLRRDLESAGLSCSKLDVDRDTGGSWSSRQQSAQQQAAQQQWADQSRRQPDWSDGRVRPWSRTADSGDSRQVSAPTTRSTSRGVDFRV